METKLFVEVSYVNSQIDETDLFKCFVTNLLPYKKKLSSKTDVHISS